MVWDVEIERGVCIVTMRTNAQNKQNEEFLQDLHATFDRLDAEHPGMPMVLTANGPTFSAGLDLKYVGPMFAAGDASVLSAFQARYFATNLRLFTLARPTVAAIGGHTYAGGVITAVCCDYRITARGDHRFSLNEVPIGIPMPMTYFEILAHALGRPTATKLTLFGDEIGVEDALRLGVVDEIVDPAILRTRAIDRAASLGPHATPAFTWTKRALQSAVLERIHASKDIDGQMLDVLTSPSSIAALASRVSKISKG
jgi:enoyl-CoA hydratase